MENQWKGNGSWLKLIVMTMTRKKMKTKKRSLYRNVIAGESSRDLTSSHITFIIAWWNITQTSSVTFNVSNNTKFNSISMLIYLNKTQARINWFFLIFDSRVLRFADWASSLQSTLSTLFRILIFHNFFTQIMLIQLKFFSVVFQFIHFHIHPNNAIFLWWL